jgi:LPS export ABC transporter protein LptC
MECGMKNSVLLMVGITACLGFSSSAFAVEAVTTNSTIGADIAQQIEGFNLVGYSDAGKKDWDLKGDKADIVGNQVAITNVDANSYKGQEMNIKAKKGTVDKVTGDVQLERDVVITDEKGGQMKTDSLNWQRDQDLVQTEDRVKIEDKGMKVEGTGLEAHPSIKSAKLKSDVSADIMTNAVSENGKENRIQITSEGPMDLEQSKQLATFRDNVVAIELATGRKLKSDLMEVRFDEHNKHINEIVCTGNVELYQDGNVTHSDMLVYKADEQRVTISGKPKLLIDAKDIDTQSVFKY